MKTKHLILIAIAFFCVLPSSATKGDEIWKTVKDWSEYCPHDEMGDLKGMIFYDVDSDGINECFIIGEYGTACLACGNGTGRYGRKYIHVVANSISTTYLGIYKGTPYIAHQGGCGTGCHLDEYYKIEKSRFVYAYQLVSTFNPMSENEEDLEEECQLIKPGQEPREISSEIFEKNHPKADFFDLEKLKMRPIGL